MCLRAHCFNEIGQTICNCYPFTKLSSFVWRHEGMFVLAFCLLDYQTMSEIIPYPSGWRFYLPNPRWPPWSELVCSFVVDCWPFSNFQQTTLAGILLSSPSQTFCCHSDYWKITYVNHCDSILASNDIILKSWRQYFSVQWHYSEAITTLIWRQYDIILESLRQYFGVITTVFWCPMTLFWSHFDSILASLWHYSGVITTVFWCPMALFWSHYDNILASLRQYFGVVMTLFWCCYDIILKSLRQYFDVVMTVFWRRYDIILASLRHYSGVLTP